MKKSEEFIKFFHKVVRKYFIKRGYAVSETIEKKMTMFSDIIFQLDNDEKMCYDKGLIVYSEKYGQGKTFFFEVISFISWTYFKRQAFKMTDSIELVEIFKKGGEDALRDFISVPRLFIDDIGNEKKRESTAYHKGSKMDVLAYVLEYRYEKWKKEGWKLFGTTNISLQSLADLYDGRLSDRLAQSVYFENYDIMKTGSFRQVPNIEVVREDVRNRLRDEYIKANTPEEKINVDVDLYLNKCLTDTSVEMGAYGQVTLNYIKGLLLKKGVVSESELNNFYESDMEDAKKEYEKEIRDGIRSAFKSTISIVREKKALEQVNAITKEDLINFCQNRNVIKKLIQLKHQNYVFKS